MNKKLLTLLFFMISLNFYSQVNFEKAYFIDNNGIKTECFIKNKDKNDNPVDFEYKLDLDDSQIKVEDIKNVKEFKIGEVLKYERGMVKIDTSNVNLQVLNENREPEWKNATIFLKTLVESELTLYEYKKGNTRLFFYKKGNLQIEQLIYKKYIIDENLATRIGTNNDFQKQLWQNLNCDNKSIDTFLKLKYNRRDLIKYFIDYNACKNNATVDYAQKMEKGNVNVKVLAGITSSSLSLSNSLFQIEADFDKKINFTFGGEFEWILPVNKNKWSLFLAPSYNSYKNITTVVINNTGPFSSDTQIENWEASLSYLDVSAGFKYYMFLSSDSKLFVECSYSVMKVMDSDIHSNDGDFKLESKFQNGISYGIGYSFKNKFNVEIKHRSLDILDNYVYYESKYSSTSLVFGYTIFDNKKKK